MTSKVLVGSGAAFRGLTRAPRIAPLISALGVSFFLQSSALLVFGAEYRNYETYEYIEGSLEEVTIDWIRARVP